MGMGRKVDILLISIMPFEKDEEVIWYCSLKIEKFMDHESCGLLKSES